jgi:hypothetical protein
MRLIELQEGDGVRAEGRFFFQRGGQLCDELGRLTYPKDWDATCQPAARRYPTAGVPYEVVTTWREDPHLRIMYQDLDGYRHVIELRHWRMELAFLFPTIDPRSPTGTTHFKASSGKFARRLVQERRFQLQIDDAGRTFCEIAGRYRVASGQ